jgi:hypothetical protein
MNVMPTWTSQELDRIGADHIVMPKARAATPKLVPR